MESHSDQISDSPSKNSYIGSYYQPPDRIQLMPRQLAFHSSVSGVPQPSSPQASQNKPNIDNRAVVDALKTLQQKIRRLELERKQAEKHFQQFSHDALNQQQVAASDAAASRPAAGQPEADTSRRKELDSKLQSAEARCSVLEKQLDYMRKMVETAKEKRNTLMENQATLQNQQPSSSSSHSQQQEKLEKLESECLKLSRTQALAEAKLASLEQKLLEEEHERQLVQEKADQLQRELDINLQLSAQTSEETKPKKKTKKKTCRKKALVSPTRPERRMIPFVAGMSTSPSHSVHANIQSILHMMKHHQPQLCERVSALQRSASGVKKSLQRDFAQSSAAPHRPDWEIRDPDQPLESLTDLLLALQDELGQMSFEHQELAGQIDTTQHPEQRRDLQRDLERLVARMEEKGTQITKLRRHQQTVHKLTQNPREPTRGEKRASRKSSVIQPPAPSPVTAKRKGEKAAAVQNNLRLLRETQKFRNSLKQDDLSWET